MTDLINKKLTFPQSQITIKITQMIYSAQTKVYLCSDVNNNSNSYCLKIMQSRSDDKINSGIINTEIILLMSLKQSANIINMIDYTTEEKSNVTSYFILLEFCSNGSLKDYISKIYSEKNAISESQIWKIALNLATGLNCIHNIKYAHRDLKPENILVSLEGEFKISDFSSSTNRYYETITNYNRNEIIFDISKNTSQSFRAPEQVDLYAGYPINEKVDVWALGILIYTLAFDNKPFNEFTSGEFNQMRKGDLFTEEMINNCNPLLIELLKMLLKNNPKERSTAADVINFIEKNANLLNLDGSISINKSNYAENLINLTKKNFTFTKKISEATAKLFKRHSTQFWVLKLTNEALDYPPKFKYIKNIVIKAWQKREKVVKVYINLSSRPLHFISSVALKTAYVLHHYIFLGPIETVIPKEFNFEEFLVFFINLWTARLNNENYDKEDKLKNPHITKFIVSYADFLKTKISFHRKYPFVENNFSLDSIIKSNHDITMLIEKKFINDLLSLYSSTFQKIVQIPISVRSISKTIDLIIQIFNEELYSIFCLLFYLIVAYKKLNSNNKNENIIKAYDSHFLEISSKIQDNLDKFQKYRNEIKSSNQIMNLTNKDCQEYFKTLDSHLKFFPIGEFNLRIFFANDLDNMVSLNSSIGRLVDSNILDKDYMQAKKKLNNPQLNITNEISSFPAPISKRSDKKTNNLIMNDQDNSDSHNNSREGIVIGGMSKSRSNSNVQRISNLIISNNLKKEKNETKQQTTSSNRKSNASVSKIEPKKPFEFTEEKFLNSKKNFDFDSVLNGPNKISDDNSGFESIFSNRNNKTSKPPILINNITNKNFVNVNNITTNIQNTTNIVPLKSTNSNFNKNNSNVQMNQTPFSGFPQQKDESSKGDLISFDMSSEQKGNNLNANVSPNLNLNHKTKESMNNLKHGNKMSSITNIMQINENENFVNNSNNNQNNQSLFNYNFFSKSQNNNEPSNNNINYNNESFVTAVSRQPSNINQRKEEINQTKNNIHNEKNLDMNVMNVLNEIFDSNKSDLSNNNNKYLSNNQDTQSVFSNATYQLQNNQNMPNFNQNKQTFVNRQNVTYVNNLNHMNNMNISPNQIPNQMQNMNYNPNNFNNQNFFNFYPNQIPNNMFFPPQGNLPQQMAHFIPQQSIIPFNPNISVISNMNMDNNIYDTDKVKKTLYEMDKVYNNTTNNINNQNIGNFTQNINNQMNFNPNANLNNKNNQHMQQDIIPMANQNRNINVNVNQNINNQNEKSGRSYSNAAKNNERNSIIGSNTPSPNLNIQDNQRNINQNINMQDNNLNNNFNNQNPNNINNLNIDQNKNLNKTNNPHNNNPNNKKKSNADEYENEIEDFSDLDCLKSQFKSDISNINIFNIETHINNISVYKEDPSNDIEKIANDFLCEQFTKGNLHWLISSKDIEREKQIGFGGSSEVYKGNYRGTEVAIKKLRIIEVKDENLKEFKREVSSLVMLRHPNLVLFMGAIAEKDNICIVTEYCAGGTLFNILHQRKELIITWELRIRILFEIAVGMNFLHTNNPPIIHRDLKSLNILLTEKIERPTDNTKIKISDFGLSRIIRQFDSGKQQMTGQLGTCHWMAPEVIENKNYTLKADVFSFGIIIWEICSRKTPYHDMTQQQISFYVTVKKGRPDKSLIPHNAPPAIIKLMESCWDAEPDKRPTFSQILEYIKKIKL